MKKGWDTLVYNFFYKTFGRISEKTSDICQKKGLPKKNNNELASLTDLW